MCRLRVIVLQFLAVLVMCGACGSSPPTTSDGIYDFIYAEHDLFHVAFPVYGDHDDGGTHFFPSGWQGDLVDYPGDPDRVFTTNCTERPYSGLTCMRLEYPAKLSGKGWIGIQCLFPEGSWKGPGYDLRHYAKSGLKLVFHFRGSRGGEVADFQVGGADGDSFGMRKITKLLGKEWARAEINLSDLGENALRSVGLGFGVTMSRDLNPGGAVIYMDEIRLEAHSSGAEKRLKEPRFVRSYVPQKVGEPDRIFRNSAYLYDNSLILILACARGRDEDLRHARLIGDAMVYAQKHDPIGDGRIRNASSCGDIGDPSRNGIPRVPGWWDYDNRRWGTDDYAVATDVGNMSWAAISLLSLHGKLGGMDGAPYLDAAHRLCRWIHEHCRSEVGAGGYTGGQVVSPVKGSRPSDETWKSAEHNIDVYVAFTRLAAALSDPVWKERAGHARRFVTAMFDPVDGHLCCGTMADGKTVRKKPVPLDVAPWALLALRDPDPRFARAMDWVSKECWVDGTPENPQLRGYDFNTDRDAVWFEGTGMAALAHRLLGQTEREQECLKSIRTWGMAGGETGGVYAASKDGLTTGFVRDWGPWVYYRRLHTGGASCWSAFALMGWNPYWDEKIEGRAPGVERSDD